ncbi:MAG TPA: low-specificity L-threonine aldolase [Burkholderiaceae bacterium]|nr:low-specificity L-threonine aldolase [Burkholderiaceae bacterium]
MPEFMAGHAGALVDLRSDTVTRPTAAMRAAMAAAEVGDDVYGEDPTVNRLQAVLAERLGYEAGLFCPSGTQSNLIALMTHCARGDEYLVGQHAHTYKYEGGGAAVLGSIQPQPLEHEPDGSLALERIDAAIKPDDVHYARTRLLALENTIRGKVLASDYTDAATALAHARGLATHLDGARLFNAAVALGRPAADLLRGFDSASICLSKGLGAPVGSVLLGSRDFIAAAQRPRKLLGGGMRQAGVLAAAGLHALDHHVDRLAEDHARAAHLAAGLRGIDGLRVEGPHTNMVFVDVHPEDAVPLAAHLRRAGVWVSAAPRLRLVTHLDVDDQGIATAIAAFADYYARVPACS